MAPTLGFPIDSGTLDLFTPGMRKRGAGSEQWVKAVRLTIWLEFLFW